MGEKDSGEKTLEAYNDVFADIINVLLFNGEKRIKENELDDVQPFSQYKADDGKLHEQERDTAKYWRDTTFRIALIGMENQTYPDRDMPLRIIGYDGASYRSQLYNEKDENGNVFRNKNPRYPVFTLVLYFGTEKWDKRKLTDCFEIPKGLEDYFNDYKINVFEICRLPMDVVYKFTSDFRVVAEYFVMTAGKNADYQPTSQTIVHVDEVLKLLKVMTHDDNIGELFLEENTEKGASMESYFTVLYKRGIGEGREEGIDEHLILLICKKLRRGKDIEVIADEVEESEDRVRDICELAEPYAPAYDEKLVIEAYRNRNKESALSSVG